MLSLGPWSTVIPRSFHAARKKGDPNMFVFLCLNIQGKMYQVPFIYFGFMTKNIGSVLLSCFMRVEALSIDLILSH